jgi:O-antigen ligase
MSLPFWALALLLVLLFLCGGSSRADVEPLILLRPATVIALAYGLWRLDRLTVRAYRILYWMMAACFAAILLQLVPLPPLVWQALPGRGRILAFAQAAGSSDVWRPLTLVPWGTWNALYFMFGPAAILVLATQITVRELRSILALLIILGFCSAGLGLLQALDGSGANLYFYERTQVGSIVGVFANRNHEAMLISLLFPGLATFAVTAEGDYGHILRVAALIGSFLLVPLLLITGSRAGLAVSVIAIAAEVIIFRISMVNDRGGSPRRARLIAAAIGFAATILVTAALWLARADAIVRILNDPAQDLRFRFWKPVLHMAAAYFPAGSGWGSFVEAYQVDEPRDLLAITYLNHAHNDWIEVAMTGGIVGVILLGTALALWAWSIGQLFRTRGRSGRSISLARLGACWMGIAGLMSLSDYPLRVPFLAAYFVIASVWLAAGFLRRDAAYLPSSQREHPSSRTMKA